MISATKCCTASVLLPHDVSNKQVCSRNNKPLMYISIIFGISPIVIKRGVVKYSFLRGIIGKILILSTALLRMYLERYEEKVNFFSGVAHARNLLLPISCILSTFFVVLHGKMLVEVLEEALELSVHLEKDYFKSEHRMQIFYIILSIAVLVSRSAHEYFTGLAEFTYEDTAIGLCDAIMDLTIWFLQLQFVFMVSRFSMLLKVIQKSIMKLITSNEFKNSPPAPKELDAVFSLYEKVITQTENLNKGYGCALGVFSLAIALHTITLMYFFIVISDRTAALGITLNAVIGLVEQWLILSATDNFVSKIGQIGQVVYKALRDVPWKQTQEQLQNFQVYLLQRKMSFTISGLVPLDYSLFFTMITTITTYVVILVQFQGKADLTPKND